MTLIDHRNARTPRTHSKLLNCIRSNSGQASALLLITLLAGCQSTSSAQDQNPAELLLTRSLHYHDPAGMWGQEPTLITWTSTRPSGEVSYVFKVEFKANGDFVMHGTRAGHELEYMVVGDTVRASVDGHTELDDDVRKRMGLRKGKELFWRNYVGFLGGFPMCLPGAEAQIGPKVTETELDGQAVLAFDVRFDPEVGDDTYTFYFEPDSARLVGCRFYWNGPKEDGETILYEGESQVGSLRLPRFRRWYTNAGNRFLGTDEIAAW